MLCGARANVAEVASGTFLPDLLSPSVLSFVSLRHDDHKSLHDKMSLFTKFNSLTPKTRNLIVAGSLTSFVLGVYFYTMRAVGGTDELQVAIDKFEGMKNKNGA